ncbi:MAG: UDP-N-acetylmuramoyl-L-alanyl-D-glutamate--2,6-diaminopimelate ligase [Bacilli bacterium]
MKKLSELYDTNYQTEIHDISINSKQINKGDIFVCIKGVNADRHNFIDEAIKNGASAIVVSHDVGEKNIPTIKVADTNKELHRLSKEIYDYPDKKLTMIGITGTDGKTSTTTIIQTLLGKNNCGYIGTNGYSYKNIKGDTDNTTPECHKLYKLFSEFEKNGCKYCSMETSSEAFFRNRLDDIEFDISGITNITKEHLNSHGSYENYIDCKCQLFRQTKKDGYCILNHDDEKYEKCKMACNGKIATYGKGKDNTLQILNYTIYPDHTDIIYKYENKEYEVTSPLLGEFNVYNLACGLLVCLKLGYKFENLEKNIKNIYVDGRLEMLNTNTPYYVMVDYAHTPNGINNLLNFIHTLDVNRSIVVIGSAGERDHIKRPLMGQAVLDNASYAIFCYEDPRSEDPIDIINDLLSNAEKDHNNYEIIVDRHEAIQKAIDIAQEKDIVLILGKGNETYQKLKDKTIYFNDVEEAYKAVENRKNREKQKGN